MDQKGFNDAEKYMACELIISLRYIISFMYLTLKLNI